MSTTATMERSVDGETMGDVLAAVLDDVVTTGATAAAAATALRQAGAREIRLCAAAWAPV